MGIFRLSYFERDTGTGKQARKEGTRCGTLTKVNEEGPK